MRLKKQYYKLKEPWDFGKGTGDGLPGEIFGRGSIAEVLFREDLPDIVHFTGRRARRLGCCIYDFRSDMILESSIRKGRKWVKCKGPNLKKRNEKFQFKTSL